MKTITTILPLITVFLAGTLFAETQLRDGESLLEEANARIRNVNTTELSDMLAKAPETVVIDVRTPREIELFGGSIRSLRSFNIPSGWLEFRIADRAPTRDTPIVVYCGINQRSPLAAERLMRMGYTNVANYADGFFAWRDGGHPVSQPDQALNSQLYRLPQKVAGNVWSAIGATAPPTYANGGHNNNLSFIVTDEGVLVVNAGDNYLLARALHQEIRKITEQPVKYVVWENGQGHAMGGTAYWKEQGAHIIAHEDALEELERHGEEVIARIRRNQRDKSIGTVLTAPDETFSEQKIIEMGGTRIEIMHLGPAHSPGDISIWLPQQKLVIAGDIAFHQRMLPVFEYTDTAAWIETWDKFAELGAKVVIPGHGDPTDMDTVTRYTVGYLKDVRGQIGKLIEDGGTLEDVYTVDQSKYQHLDTFEQLSTLNASTIFRHMEFE
jgi:glyoxylase-like metal-dependent hydrolase (beta-lactamase superfamily II)/rhodanese-related sulfurtransferase